MAPRKEKTEKSTADQGDDSPVVFVLVLVHVHVRRIIRIYLMLPECTLGTAMIVDYLSMCTRGTFLFFYFCGGDYAEFFCREAKVRRTVTLSGY